MTQEIFRYTFAPSIPVEELKATLLLTILAAESLHGATQVRLYAAHAFDDDRRVCVIDARSEVGRDVNQLFAGFLHREFGDGLYWVERVDDLPVPQQEEQRR